MSHRVEKEAKRLPLRIAYQFLQPKFQNIFLKIQQIVPAKTQKEENLKDREKQSRNQVLTEIKLRKRSMCYYSELWFSQCLNSDLVRKNNNDILNTIRVNLYTAVQTAVQTLQKVGN